MYYITVGKQTLTKYAAKQATLINSQPTQITVCNSTTKLPKQPKIIFYKLQSIYQYLQKHIKQQIIKQKVKQEVLVHPFRNKSIEIPKIYTFNLYMSEFQILKLQINSSINAFHSSKIVLQCFSSLTHQERQPQIIIKQCYLSGCKNQFIQLIDKSKIEDGLDQLKDLKMLIEKEIRVLNDSLKIKRAKLQRVQLQRNYSLQELKTLDVAILKQQNRMQSTLGSSLKQNQSIKSMEQNLSALQKKNVATIKKNRDLNNQLVDAKRKILTRIQNIRDSETKRSDNQLLIQDLQVRVKNAKDNILGYTFNIEQRQMTIVKIKNDTSQLKQYNSKLGAVNTNVKAEIAKIQDQVSRNQMTLTESQRKLQGAQLQLKDSVSRNKRNVSQNQSLECDNYRLYQQNKGLALQEASDKNVLGYLQQTNVKFRAALNQKQIINKHTQSVLRVAKQMQVNGCGIEVFEKSLGSTGSCFY